MLETITSINGTVNGVVWGPVGLALLFGTGLVMTVRTGGFQFGRFGHWMKNTIGAIFTNKNVTAEGGYGHQPVPEPLHGACRHHWHG